MIISEDGILEYFDSRDLDENRRLVIPEGVTGIKKWPFAPKKGQFKRNMLLRLFLSELVIPGSMKKINPDEFRLLSGLEKVIFNEGVEEIGEGAFFECGSLREVDFAKSIKKIGAYAFGECFCLQKFTLPPDLKEIEKGVFYNCGMLPEVDIPKGVTSIQGKAFKGCISLKKINFEQDSELKYFVISAVEDCEKLKSLNLPYTVDNLYLFGTLKGCKSLESITLRDPDGIFCLSPKCKSVMATDELLRQFLPEKTEIIRHKNTIEAGGKIKV